MGKFGLNVGTERKLLHFFLMNPPPPFGKNDPWNLEVMFPQRDQLPDQLRNVGITFLQAMRQAQPFRLPPDEESYKSRVLPLSFRLDELPQ